MKRIFTLLFISLLILNGCDSNKNDLVLEKDVMNDIFEKLVDTMYIDFRIPPYPPPPLPEFDKNGDIIFKKEDSLKEKSKRVEYHKRISELKIKLKKDTTRLLIGVYDTIYGLDIEHKKGLVLHFKSIENDSMSLLDSTMNILDLSNFKNSSKFIFRKRSKFPNRNKIWNSEYDSPFSGIIWFSRIHFDKSKTYGVLIVNYTCGRLCGHTNKIFIRKENKHWKIDKIILMSVS